jgi:5-methylcytosine-specific restriction protein A
MPNRIKTICRYPGCGRIVRGRFCQEHRRAYRRAAGAGRATSAQRGYDARWRRLRRWYIQQQPLCEDCLEENMVNVQYLEVDHIVPIDIRPDLRLEPTNLRTRCRMHHRQKTLQDMKRYGTGARRG